MFFVRSLPAPLHSSFRVLPRVPRNGGPRTGAFFVSGTAFLLSLAPSVGEVAPPSVLVSALSAGSAPLGRAWFLGERSSLRYSSFCGPAPSPAMCSQANVSLRRGPPRATKVQQLLIFGVPPSPGEADQGGSGLLPAAGEPGVVSRFSPDFRVLSQKMGQKGLARGCFPHFAGCFPTCYVNLANFPLVIENTSSRTPIFL